jgi:microcystin-dependent protein
MSDSYIGEIRLFAGNFAPKDWAFCDGQQLPIAEFDTLFALIGTTYGGDGQSTFALPDLRGRLPIHQGTGPGLSPRTLGEPGGAEGVVLTAGQLPAHRHTLFASTGPATSTSPSGNVTATASGTNIYGAGAPSIPMSGQATTQAGGSLPHQNLMPYLCLNFIISLFGVFPPRT